jgi:hypothetical protein
MRSGLVSSIIKIAVPVIAGIGLATVADKNLVDKIPVFEETGLTLEPKKILTIVVIFTVATLLVRFIGKKMNINLLK